MSSVEVAPPKPAPSEKPKAMDIKQEEGQPDQVDSSEAQSSESELTTDFTLALHEGEDEWTLPKLTHNPPPEKYEPVAKFVARACRDKAEGVSAIAYKAMISLLRAEDMDVPMVHYTLLAFRRDATTFHLLFDKSLAQLLHCTLQLNPLRRNKSHVLLDPFLHLLVAMASAKPVYCPHIFRTLWRMGVYKDANLPENQHTAVYVQVVLDFCNNL